MESKLSVKFLYYLNQQYLDYIEGEFFFDTLIDGKVIYQLRIILILY